MNWFAIAIGGGLGATLRYSIGLYISNHYFAIWITNILGCTLLGAALAVFTSRNISQSTELFIGVGFLASLTTFSTMSAQILQLLQLKQLGFLLLYVVSINVVGCTLLVLTKHIVTKYL